MGRPADTIVVKDDAGEPRQRFPVDAREIVQQGGTYDVTDKDVVEATTRTDDGHPTGMPGVEVVEVYNTQLVKNVEAKGGQAAKNDPDTKADAKAGQEAPKG